MHAGAFTDNFLPCAKRARTFVEQYSIKITNKMSVNRNAPTLDHLPDEIALLSGEPIPPAPTIPRMVASFRLISKR